MKEPEQHQEFIFRRKAPTYDWAKITLVITNDVPKSSDNRDMGVAAAVARTVCNDSRITVILPFNANVGVCAHEATHVAVFVLDTSGVALSTVAEGMTITVNDEPLAYLIDQFAEWFAQKLCVVGKKTGVIPDDKEEAKQRAAVALGLTQPSGEVLKP